jgi:hypothetical protein
MVPLPHLQSDNDAAAPSDSSFNSTADRMAELEAVFGRDLLAQSPSGFWRFNPDARRVISASAASKFYLQHHFGVNGVLSFDEYFRIWARCFFETRADNESARAILTLFLHENLAALKDLFILDRTENQAVKANAEAVRSCTQSAAHAALFEGDAFARWVLQEWLPSHLGNCTFYCGSEDAEQSAEECMAA